VVEKGASTCVMSLVCWKAISQPGLSPSPTFLTEFNSQSSKPHGIIPSFPMHIGGKVVCVKVEVVDAPLDYNLLLGRSWTYAMHAVVATIFHPLLFPHKGCIVIIEKLSFSHLDPSSGASIVLMINNPQPNTINLAVGLCPSLMGNFDYPPPSGNVKLISVVPDQPRANIFQVFSFRTTYFHDPWTLLSPLALMEGAGHPSMAMPLSTTEFAYNIVHKYSTELDSTPTHELDPVLEPIWA
jgi:hypothetical protein